MMKSVLINASPRNEGNSSFVIDSLKEAFSGDVKTIRVNELNFSGCQGCKKCRQLDDFCVLNDDMNSLYADLTDADIITVVSPNYYGFITGQLKLFMDRWYCMKDKRGITRFKENAKVFFVLTQGSPDRNHGETANKWMKRVSEAFGMKFFSYIIPGCNADTRDMVKMKISDIKMHLKMIQ